jgi:uncharacterized protein (UPF0332 family)
MMRRNQRTKRTRVATWQDWLKNRRLCGESLQYFERRAFIKRLDVQHAKDNVLGHMKKSFHNLSLANQVFESNQKGQLNTNYSGESFYDWVITISYYAMYQACLAALAAVGKEGENHTAAVCALIYYYVHKQKRLHEQYLVSLNTISALANQDVQKLVEKRFEREKASYDTGLTTQLGLAQTALSEAREFVLKIREILEASLEKDFLREV